VSDVQVAGERRSQYSFNALPGYRREGGNENVSVERMENRNIMPDGYRSRRCEHAQTLKRRHQSQPTRHLLSTETERSAFRAYFGQKAFIRRRQTCLFTTKLLLADLARWFSTISLTLRCSRHGIRTRIMSSCCTVGWKTPWQTRFLCDTLGVQIESRVHEFVPISRICRFGDGTAMNAYHTFFLLKTDQGCDIVTEEFVK
jgi:hypothetical protein